jgi:Protein of unknown function (DUF3800)
MSSARDVLELCRAVLNGRDGWVIVLKAYMDESGTHGDSPVVTVGMYAGKPSVWQGWTVDWNRNKRPIKVYHSVDAHNRDGEFKGMERDERNKFCAKLLPVIARHKILGVAVGIHMGAFRTAMESRPELLAMFGTPYTACFQWAVQTFLAMMDENNDTQRVAFYHECNDYQEEARAAFAYVEAQRKLLSTRRSLTFGGKGDFVPLQAADVLAYESNHKLRDPSKPTRLPWEAINPGADANPEESRIRLLHYGQANMDKLISLLGGYRQRLLASGWDGKVA